MDCTRYDITNTLVFLRLWGVIKEQERKIASGDASQYMIFTPVTKSQLSRVDRKRGSFRVSLRFMYCGLEKVLVVKLMPSSITISRLPQMGLSAFDIFFSWKYKVYRQHQFKGSGFCI